MILLLYFSYFAWTFSLTNYVQWKLFVRLASFIFYEHITCIVRNILNIQWDTFHAYYMLDVTIHIVYSFFTEYKFTIKNIFQLVYIYF